MWRKIKHYLLAGSVLAAVGANVVLLDVSKTGTSPKLSVISAATPTGETGKGIDTEVFRFILKATDADFRVQKIIFNKTGTCSSSNTGGEVKLVDADDQTVYASLAAPPDWFAQKSFYLQNFSPSLIIFKGETKTLALKGDTNRCKGAIKFVIPSMGVAAQYPKLMNVYKGNVAGNILKFSSPLIATNLKANLLWSPNGQGYIKKQKQEMLRFSLGVSGSNAIAIKDLSFKIDTTCQFSANPINAWLYEENNNTPVKKWALISENSFNTSDFVGKTIAASKTKVYSLFFDTTACKSGDKLKFSLDSGQWQTVSADPVISGSLAGTPIQGGTIVY